MSLLTFVSCLPRLINENSVRTFHVINFSSFYSLLLPSPYPSNFKYLKIRVFEACRHFRQEIVSPVFSRASPAPLLSTFPRISVRSKRRAGSSFSLYFRSKNIIHIIIRRRRRRSLSNFARARTGLPWISRIDIRKRTPIMGKYS